MSTNYTGDITATESPSSAPTPSGSPTVVIPADTDPLNVATCWSQQYKVITDYITYLQKIVNGQPVYTPGTNQYGFTDVTHTGSGPSNGVAVASVQGTNQQSSNAPYSFVIKITSGGAVGTALFSISYDGGATYPTTGQTTAATYTISNGGYSVVINFSGTLVTNDLYAFRSTDVSQISCVDYHGNAGFEVDHNGIPKNRLTFEENWITNNTASQSSADAWGALGGSAKWQMYTHLSGTLQMSVPSGGNVVMPFITLNTSTSSGSYSAIRAPITYIPKNPKLIVYQVVVYPTSSDLNWEAEIGLCDSTLLVSPTYAACFDMTVSGGIVPKLINGSAFTGKSTSYVAANQYRLKCEVDVVASISRFFVNDVLVLSTPHLPAGNLYFTATSLANAGLSGAASLYIGHLRVDVKY